MYSEALRKQVNNRPRWQNWIGVVAIFIVWLVLIKASFEGYSQHPITSIVICNVLNAAMIYILFMIGSNDSAAHQIDNELGEQIIFLKYERDVLREKYVALQNEHAELLKQTQKQ